MTPLNNRGHSERIFDKVNKIPCLVQSRSQGSFKINCQWTALLCKECLHLQTHRMVKGHERVVTERRRKSCGHQHEAALCNGMDYMGCPKETMLAACRLILLVRWPITGGGPTRTGRLEDPGRRDLRLGGSGGLDPSSLVGGRLTVAVKISLVQTRRLISGRPLTTKSC